MMPDLPTLIAQAAPDVGQFEQWWHYGPLGAFAFIVASIAALLIAFAGYFAYTIWAPDYRERRKEELEHQRQKRLLELEKEQKQNALYDTLRECQIADQGYKQRQVALTESVLAGQAGHASDCAVTREVVVKIARHLEVET
jgi:hypothetical protein